MVAPVVTAHDHVRVLSERVTILAMIQRAGLYNKEHGEEIFLIQPATDFLDKNRKTDYAIFRRQRRLPVDITESGGDFFIPNERFDDRRRKKKKSKGYQGFNNLNHKIRRSIRRAQKGGPWIYIQLVSREKAQFGPALESCFNGAWDQFKDGEKFAQAEICPIHGSSCSFAQKLFDFGEELNIALKNEHTEARYFAMPLNKPPF